MARKRRDASLPAGAFLIPINIKDLGDTEKDPCFSKLYDLMAPECQSCGDNELCGIAFAHKQKARVLEQEKQDKNLDLLVSDLELDKDLKEYTHKRIQLGLDPSKVTARAARKFKVTKEYVKLIISSNGYKGLPKH
jgi:ribosomal protein L28